MKSEKFLYVIFIIFIVMLPLIPGQGQEVLISEKPNYDKQVNKWGPNRLNHLHYILDIGHHLSFGDEFIPSSIIGSYSFASRVQYKRKLSPNFAIVVNTGIEQHRLKFIPNTVSPISGELSHEKEWLLLHWSSSEAFLRINIDGKRGDYLGKYCDLGLFYNQILGSRHVFIDNAFEEAQTFKRSKTIMKGLHYITKQAWGFAVRIAFDTVAVHYQYQLSPSVLSEDITKDYTVHQLGISYSIVN